MSDKKVQTSAQCCLCGDPYAGHGNNPEPLSESGRCCDDCNSLRVVPARMNNIFRWLQDEKQSDKQVKYV